MTCYCEHDSAERDPSLFPVPSEVLDDVHWVDGPYDSGAELEEIVETDAANKCEPDADDRSEAVADFVGPKSLYHEQAHRYRYRYPNNPICTGGKRIK